MTERMTFENIVEKEPLIISAVGNHARSGRKWFDDVYGKCSFAQLDIVLLRDVIECTKREQAWMKNPGVHTTARVAAVIDRFFKVLDGKLVYFQGMVERHGYSETGRYAKNCFKEIVQRQLDLVRIAEQKVLLAGKEFSMLEEAVFAVSESSDAKRDLNNKYGCTTRKSQDLRGNESLVVAALYVSLIEGRSSAVVTNDSDIARLVAATMMVVPDKSKARVRAVPIRVYFVNKREVQPELCLVTDTAVSFQPRSIEVPQVYQYRELCEKVREILGAAEIPKKQYSQTG